MDHPPMVICTIIVTVNIKTLSYKDPLPRSDLHLILRYDVDKFLRRTFIVYSQSCKAKDNRKPFFMLYKN